MTRSGPKGKPPELKIVSGTDQPCRRREPAVAPIPGEAIKPSWLKGRAAKLWAEKVAIYRARGQAIVGCESALAQYCAIEASLIEQYRKGITPPVAQVNSFRIYAAEFYDTPASQVLPSKTPGRGGKFATNMQRPNGGADA
ncbi:hypothetical protein [Ciceribacter sp. RN22]|uniref:hypothetical protein n=1 Tax=Ciceribacter sp. RN22 TaxID=2954932 RepID=UPI002093D3D9|nr:hypothetical protein [Ciceribacter sp. RN22]MCO6178817.1 hypothetical protein [Ciceribacter sp. RN22]